MNRQYRWGIMGAGQIARRMADALHRNDRSELCRISSKDIERAKIFAEENQVESFGTYEQLLQDESLDVIYIATTHNYHYENALAVLKHGKHVLMEKPFTVHAQQADDLISLAKKNNLFLMEAMWTRFLPCWRTLKNTVQNGQIGPVSQISITFGKFVGPGSRERLSKPELAGGVTLDMGIYPISFCCFVMDSLPSAVRSFCRFNEYGVDEQASYIFDFSGNALAQVSAGFELAMENRAVIYGTKGFLIFPNFPSGNKFCIYNHRGTNTIEHEETVEIMQENNGFIYQVEEVIRCLDEGRTESTVIPLQETRDIMELMDSMRKQWGLRYPFESSS